MMLATLMTVSMGAAMAQPGSGKGPGAGTGPMGAGTTASAPGMGMGPGGGRGAARYGSDYTPGWTLMSQQERNEHRDRMRSMKTYEECKALSEPAPRADGRASQVAWRQGAGNATARCLRKLEEVM